MGTVDPGELRRLEAQFATAMRELYAVGNGLADLRHEVESSSGPASPRLPTTPAVTPAPPIPHPGAAIPTAGWDAPIPAPGPPPQWAPAAASAAPRTAPPTTTFPPVPPGPFVPAAPPGPLVPPVPPGALAPPVPQAAIHPAAAAPAIPLWQREGFVTRTLGVTGAVVTLAGLAMLLVLAVQQNWFGPVPRVVAGWVLALSLIGGSHVVRGRERRLGRSGAGAVALAATGFAAAFLCVVAMTSSYGWIPPIAGFTLAAALVAAGLWIARRWDSQSLAALTVSGAALNAPFVAGGASWVLSAFVVVLALASWPAQQSRVWPVVTAARLIPAPLIIVPTALIVRNQLHEPGAHLVVTAVLALGGLAMAAVDASRDRHPELASMTVILAGLPLLVSASLQPSPRDALALAGAAAVWLAAGGVGEASGRLTHHTTIPTVVVGTVSLLTAVGTVDAPPWRGTMLLVAATAYLAIAGATRSKLAAWSGLAVSSIAILGYLRHPITVLAQFTALRADLVVVLVDSLVTVALAIALSWLTVRTRALTLTQRRWARAVAWFVGLSVATTALVAGGVLVGRALHSAPAGFRGGHAMATILWMSTAVWLLGFGLRRARDTALSIWVGLALATVSVGKLFLYDLAALNGIWRVVAFIVVGLLLLGAGAGYAKALERSRRAGAPDPQTPPPPDPPGPPIPPVPSEPSQPSGSSSPDQPPSP